ncbi:uncharacterized protein LOC115622374 [Scaptodrosophila lebanonensis]|uniref:Uncharacterized protein LOC115622374 n=1 Tax=Drosophila lebanonensis TaxID=7225 RepID=A0A6J2T5F4_DROLE|nr:uncharacterized protein LOC115622374 [Scaptodrosophila lebanonensis]
MALKCTLFFLACLLAYVAAEEYEFDGNKVRPLGGNGLPEGGRKVELKYTDDPAQGGRQSSVRFDQNIYKTQDGRGTIDVYAQGRKMYDWDRKDFGGGVEGRWFFG